MTTAEHRRMWLTIAEAFGTVPSRRTPRQRMLAQDGLCCALYCFEDRIGMGVICHLVVATYNRMMLGATSRRNDHWRCVIACLMAAMTRREYEQLVNEGGG